ncbi:chorismate lyase [Mangrovibacter phragmitis]|uniref:chorismate lyase n=1 Tax=Mangrovibacter phragmitis TaxID=1691903 RepID=UPI003369CD40
MMHPALAQLRALSFSDTLPDNLSAWLRDWLLLEDSMTKRFERCCSKVSVTLLSEGFVTAEQVGEDVSWLPRESQYWLREIILLGDDTPWLVGRTVVPLSTLNGPELALQRLGTTPLGRYLFTASALTRDFIHTGRSETLWGRRSRLRLSGKPLLLTELFLPASPLYQEDEKWSGV